MHLFITLLTLTAPSHAIHGKYLPTSENPPQTCKVEVRTENTTGAPGICSSTLIKPTFLFTASHCLDLKFWGGKITSIAVTCGNLAPIAAKLDSPGMPNYLGSDSAPYNDVGLIELTAPIDPKIIPPMLVENNLEYIQGFETTYGRCRMSGFGYSDNKDNKGNPEKGVQHTTEAPFRLFLKSGPTGENAFFLFGKYYRTQFEKENQTQFEPEELANESNRFDHGDSGGTFYCRDGKYGNQWRLVGIYSAAGASDPTGQTVVLPAYPSNWKFLMDNYKQRRQ